MKKLLVLLGLTGALFAARYPMIMEYNYLKGCIGEKGMEDYCICTLNAIENKYTLNEFLTVLQNKKKSKEMINYAVNECLDKLKK
jgi:hypothetical protein